jgi:hypothetical protein
MNGDSVSAAVPSLSAQDAQLALGESQSRAPDLQGHYTLSSIVESRGYRYLLRRKKGGFDGFDPRQLDEATALALAASHGVRVPALAYSEESYLIEQYVVGDQAGERLDDWESWYRDLVAQVERLQSSPATSHLYYSVAGWERWLATYLRSLHESLAAEYGARFDLLGIPSLDHVWRLGPVDSTGLPLVLAHSDLHQDNLLLSSDGVWILDWELALVADPVWEAARALHTMRWPSEADRLRAQSIWVTSLESRWPSADISGRLDWYRQIETWKSLLVDSVRYPQQIADAPLDEALALEKSNDLLRKLTLGSSFMPPSSLDSTGVLNLLRRWSCE